MSRRQSWSIVCLIFVSLSSIAFAQYDTGSIVGVVRDNSGAVISDVDVKVTNTKTGRVLSVKTGSVGEYSVPGLPAGPYTVEASHPGFDTGVVSDIVLYATATRAVDVTLKVGTETQNVTVTAEATAVNTQTSGSGGTINGTQVENLPLNGRDFTTLTALVPGSVTSASAAQQSLGGYETFLAGVNVLLDGADATRIDTNAVSTQLGRQESRISRASVDSIAEFEVMSGTYSAEFGRSSGDVVNIITKSGGNVFHGTAFEFFRNDGMDAKNYFETIPTALHLNQFGGNFGGPIVRDKLFFFVNYEGVRQNVESPSGPVPVMTAATKAAASTAMAPVVNQIPLPNPALGPVVFPGGVVRPDLGYFEGNLRNTIREDTGSAKVDYNFSSRDTFSFRYNIADSFTSTQYGVAQNQVSPSPGRNHLLKGTWNHIFTASVLNEFGIAYNRPWTDSLGGGDDLPIFQCSAFWGCGPSNDFGAAPGPVLFSSHRPQHSLQFLDTVSWTKGRHSIRAGLDIRHAVTQDALFPQNFIAYDGITDFLANQGEQFSTLGHNLVGVQNTDYSFFIQDDFRIAPRLTLNLGLRYDYFSVLHGSLIQNFNVQNAIANPTSSTENFGAIGAGLYKPDRNNFGPRIGFAWDPYGKGKTVVRGGFGVFYSPALTGAALSLAGNAQQGYNVNFIGLAFGLTTCTPSFGQPPAPFYFISIPLPNPLPVCTPAPPPNVNGLDPNMRDTYTMHWSLGVQQQIAPNTVLEVSYVGNRGVKLPAGAAYAGQELNLSPFGTVANSNFGNIRRLGNFVNSHYNSLQTSVRRHMGHGLNLDANYTWSHETDDGINILLGAYQNSHNPKGDYASGDIDVRNNFTLGATWDLPNAQFLPKSVGKGWQITSLIQARSGLPVNIALAPPFLGIDQIRPNLVPGASITPANYSVPRNQFNIHALVPPGAGQYGDLGRNAGRGPGFTQIDFGLSKTTQITERVGIQFGGQLFNLFNHPNFNSPDGYMSDANFGKSTSTVGNQVGPGTSRQAQLFLKFLF